MNQFIERSKEILGIDGINIPLTLWEEKDDTNGILTELINNFNSNAEEVEFIINTLLNPDSIVRRNIYIIIQHLINKSSLNSNIITNIKNIIQKRIEKLIRDEKEDYMYYDIELRFLCNPTNTEVKKILNKKIPTDMYYNFFSYYIKKNYREDFEYILIKYIKNYKEDKSLYLIITNKESLDYIGKSDSTSILLIESLQKNKVALYRFFQYSYRSDRKNLLHIIFNNIDQKLIQSLIYNIMKDIFEDRRITYHLHIDNIIDEEFYKYLLLTQQRDIEFVKKIIKYLNHERQYRSQSISIIKGILNSDNIHIFLTYKRSFYLIYNLYNQYSTSNDDNILSIKEKIYILYEQEFKENDKKNIKLKQQQEKQLSDKEKSIKRKIQGNIDELKQLEKENGKRYFSSKVLYDFKEHKDFFDDEQKEVIIEQIILFLTSEYTDPSNENAKVELKEKGSFTRPSYIQDLTLCIELSQDLQIDLQPYIERLIHLIPYVFHSDTEFWKAFKENNIIIDEKNDIDWLLSIYNGERHGDLQYLHPGKLAELIEDKYLIIDNIFDEQQLKKLSLIIKNIVTSQDDRISIWIKTQYFQVLEKHPQINNEWIKKEYNNFYNLWSGYNYFEDFLQGGILQEKREQFEYFFKLNGIVIKLFKDDLAIKRRLDQFLGFKTDYVRIIGSGVYSPSTLESELQRGGRFDEPFYKVIIDTLEYPEYKSEIENILKNAESFTKDDSLSRSYLYKFVADYYKKVPERDQIKVYSTIPNNNFILRYLEVSKWDNTNKLKFQFQKKQLSQEDLREQEKSKLIYEIEEKKKEIRYTNEEYKQYKLQQEIIILTEGKTDWQHLKKIANELQYINAPKAHIYKFFLNYVKEYTCEMGDEPLFKFSQTLSKIFNAKKVIAIFDTDGNMKNKYFKAPYIKINDNVWKDPGIDNLRYVTLPKPADFKKNKQYYDEKGWCIEHFYQDKILKDFFIVPRDIKPKNEISGTSYHGHIQGFFFFKYRKKIFSKTPYKGLKTIYDSDEKYIFSYKNGEDIGSIIKSKSIFANKIETFSLPHKDIKRFDPIFTEIYNAAKDLGIEF